MPRPAAAVMGCGPECPSSARKGKEGGGGRFQKNMGLNTCQYHFEISLRYMLPQLRSVSVYVCVCVCLLLL